MPDSQAMVLNGQGGKSIQQAEGVGLAWSPGEGHRLKPSVCVKGVGRGEPWWERLGRYRGHQSCVNSGGGGRHCRPLFGAPVGHKHLVAGSPHPMRTTLLPARVPSQGCCLTLPSSVSREQARVQVLIVHLSLRTPLSWEGKGLGWGLVSKMWPHCMSLLPRAEDTSLVLVLTCLLSQRCPSACPLGVLGSRSLGDQGLRAMSGNSFGSCHNF